MANIATFSKPVTAAILLAATFWNGAALSQDSQAPEIDALLANEGEIKSLFDCLALFYAYEDSKPAENDYAIGVGFSNVDFGDFMGEQTQQALENAGIDTMDDTVLGQLEARLNARLRGLEKTFEMLPGDMPLPLSSDNLDLVPDEIVTLDSKYRACIIVVLEKMNNPIVPLNE